MLNDIQTSDILFFDIETVPQRASFAEVDEDEQALWHIKAESLNRGKEYDLAESYAQAGIYAEFGKIVCISVGYVTGDTIHTASYAGDDEREILLGFGSLLAGYFPKRFKRLCGHNAKEFDIPYVARRMVVHRIPLPPVIDIAGKKPWEVNHLDTLELWRFGDYKSFTSLKLLTHIFGIPTPKDDIDGSQVAGVYYNEHDVARIAVYCEKDVVATARVFQRLRGEKPVENVNHKDI